LGYAYVNFQQPADGEFRSFLFLSFPVWRWWIRIFNDAF
jgi:hypothetical protein